VVRITNDAEGKVLVGLLQIDKGRKAEKDGVNKILKEMLGYTPILQHNEDGKPIMGGYNISITHTIGFVAVILSREYEVGIDIEFVSSRVKRVQSRFLRDDEIMADVTDMLITWCAKETMYKLCSSEHLALKDILVKPKLRLVTNLRSSLTLSFKCECNANYVLTYVWK
jgi:siderophore (surfactin) biosynthesis regulatory protein